MITDDTTPREIVDMLNKFIVGHTSAKRAVAVALRNRWRRMRVSEELREEILPKNILLIGSTGIGKTEMARRIARMSDAPFIKVEATKFTEIGYVGRDVDQIIRDLLEISIQQTRKIMRRKHERISYELAVQKVVHLLKSQKFEKMSEQEIKSNVLSGEFNDEEIEVPISDHNWGNLDMPGGMMQIADFFSKTLNDKITTAHMTVKKALDHFKETEADKMLDQDTVVNEAIYNVEQNGIVFIDEIDKICVTGHSVRQTTDVSREGVQRDLLPLVEGTTVTTKYGNIKTDHILFIASGAFHISKPSDLLPELQGRFPIRVELRALTEADFVQILNTTENNLKKQAEALLKTEGVELTFTEDSIREIARLAAEINGFRENIGARRLYTLMEKILEDVSFDAPDLKGQKQVIDAEYVHDKIQDLLESEDLSKFIL